ncbi:MAG: hypothetical protein Q9M91_04720 [Candidatus Dojkabacteria bacterium]|nr:hypothetical protein [Candidatus Dojkabacteria bacterium]MDQ7021113.1 hypothetical protein [Candidatus Dojkabacteria bacterium]
MLVGITLGYSNSVVIKKLDLHESRILLLSIIASVVLLVIGSHLIYLIADTQSLNFGYIDLMIALKQYKPDYFTGVEPIDEIFKGNMYYVSLLLNIVITSVITYGLSFYHYPHADSSQHK